MTEQECKYGNIAIVGGGMMIFENIREKITEKLEEEKQRFRKSKNDTITLFDSEVMAIKEQTYNFCEEIINQVEAEYNNGWISVDDKLPNETQKSYLIYYKRDGGLYGTQNLAFVSKDYFTSDRRWEIEDKHSDTKVYYWQPLPQPPKGE